jgi:uncharacterized protein (TIGR00255 family)
MTGVGFAAGATEVGELRIEVRAVNGRALALKQRLGGGLLGFETAIEAAVRARLQRGTVHVVVEHKGVPSLLPDRALLRATADELRELAREFGLQPPTLAEVVQLANAAIRHEVVTARPLPPRVAALLAAALDDLERHRRAEGKATAAAIAAQLAEFEAQVAQASERAPQLAAAYRQRLLQRVAEFVASHVPAPVPVPDLVREVAIYADRVDVAEELQRLAAHVAEIRTALGQPGEVGRRLEFLLQELLRETNTLASKSPDVSLSHVAVAMKTCIDRLKEQAANLE